MLDVNITADILSCFLFRKTKNKGNKQRFAGEKGEMCENPDQKKTKKYTKTGFNRVDRFDL